MSETNFDQLKKTFFQEADEQIEAIEEGILSLEAQGESKEAIDEMFRMAHSLKGGAGTLGYSEMARLTHEMETFLDGLRNGTIGLNDDVIDLLLLSVDVLKSLRLGFEVEDVPKEALREAEQLISRYEQTDLSGIVNNGGPVTSRNYEKLTLNELEMKYFAELTPPNYAYLIVFNLKSIKEMQNMIAFLVANNLKKIGEISKSSPPNVENFMGDLQNFIMIFESEKNKDEVTILLEQVVDNDDFTIYHWHELDEEQGKYIEIVKGSFETRNINRESVRVDIEKIDQLMRLVGELVIDKEHLMELGKRMKVRYKDSWEAQALMQTIPHIDFIATELHEAVMDIRMYPVGGIFRRFPRLTRDLSKQTGKLVNLTLSGEETELDRTILQEIFDPLVHIIRNAVDHGIEPPDERELSGKPREGQVSLSARQEENSIIIEVSDDGRGVDVEKVKEKALNLNLYSKATLDELSKGEILDLLLEPGFSTAETVSDVSGRGVGMDVVRTNIEKINGNVELQSEIGKGTTIIITLPLTMAIIQALMVQEADNDYAIPLSSVIETVSVAGKNNSCPLKTIQNREVMTWRDKVVPIIRLHEFFELSSKKGKGRYAVIVGIKDKPLGIIVESLLGEQEVVIKPLSDYLGADSLYGGVPGISGATIKGDGKVALILDIQSMLKTFKYEGRRHELLPIE